MTPHERKEMETLCNLLRRIMERSRHAPKVAGDAGEKHRWHLVARGQGWTPVVAPREVSPFARFHDESDARLVATVVNSLPRLLTTCEQMLQKLREGEGEQNGS